MVLSSGEAMEGKLAGEVDIHRASFSPLDPYNYSSRGKRGSTGINTTEQYLRASLAAVTPWSRYHSFCKTYFTRRQGNPSAASHATSIIRNHARRDSHCFHGTSSVRRLDRK